MDTLLVPLYHGVALLFVPSVLVMAFLGAVWGMIAGALPGIGSPVALGVMLPLTFALDPVAAVAFLVAISFGTGYGNSVPAVLVGVPGSPSAFLTAIDGYALHRQGRSGLGLGAAYFGTVSSQWLAIVMFTMMVIPLSRLPYYFLAPEIFALYFLGLAAVISLTGKNVLKGLVAAAIGISVGFIGQDPVTVVDRFQFGVRDLRTGASEVAVVIGVLAVGELLRGLRQIYSWEDVSGEYSSEFPSRRQLRQLVRPTVLGSVIGTFVGAIPGVGSTPATAMAYQQARFLSKEPELYGKGSPEAIAANEAAGSSANAGELVPTLGLGVPGSAATVLLLSALMIHGLVPGPLLIVHSPEMLHASIAGAIGATVAMGLTGWWLSKLLLRVALMDRSVVLVIALFTTLVGVYALRRSLLDVTLMLVAGVVGYFMIRYGYSTAAAALGVILGAGLEANLRRGLMLTNQSYVDFFTRPITAAIMAVAIALLVYGTYSTLRVAREEARRTRPDARDDTSASRRTG